MLEPDSKKAVELQKRLAGQVRTNLELGRLRNVAGVDVSYSPETMQSVASVMVLSYPDLETTRTVLAKMKTPFPYVPGLLSFREIPAILNALDRLSSLPDLIFVDGHGRAHPRRLGIASHLGLWLKQCTVGIGKTRLCGEYRDPGKKRGTSTNLVHRGELIGKVLRTRSRVKPVFVSIGYGLPLDECVRWTLAVTGRFRLSEPVRRADQLAGQSK